MQVKSAGLLLLLLTGTLYGSVSSSLCSMNQLERCTTDLEMLGQKMVPSYNPSELNTICLKWIDVEPCVSDVTAACGSTNNTDAEPTGKEVIAKKRALQSAGEWTMSYEYLCNAGKQNYDLVHRCVSENTNLTVEADECYKTYDNETWWLDRTDAVNTYTYCSAAKDMIKCLKSAGSDACGEEVADWLWAFHGQLWAMHFNAIDCSLESKFSSGAKAIVSICSCAAILVLILTIVSFFVKPPNHKDSKKKKKKKEKSGHETVNKSEIIEKIMGKENPAYTKDKLDPISLERRRTNVEAKTLEITQI